MNPTDDSLIRIALERGLLPGEKLQSYLLTEPRSAAPAAATCPLSQQLVADGELNGRALARAVAAELDLPFVELGGRAIANEVLAALPPSFVTRHQALPFDRAGDRLLVALADPLDVGVMDSLAQWPGVRSRCALRR